MNEQLALLTQRPIRSPLKVLATGDPKTEFRGSAASEIYSRLGAPNRLLTSSAKSRKSSAYGVYNRILYLTPGVFCPASTSACRAACLGHTSGNMQLPSSTLARDQRAAFYLEDQERFLLRLRGELAETVAAARRLGATPAVRLNGTSDIPWERLHGELFHEFPEISFFDYTKILPRMRSYLLGQFDLKPWPINYHLTFSADGRIGSELQHLSARGGNVAMVFWPELPSIWRGLQVIDGDLHDARFLDPQGIIVGLRAKGVARVDIDGFVVRPCPKCKPAATSMKLTSIVETTHRQTTHTCQNCGHESSSRWILPHALKAGNA